MSLSKLPRGGSSFRMSGVSGFSKKFSSMVNYGQFSSLRDNRDLAIKIFQDLVPTIRKYGRIPLSTRNRALRRFRSSSKTTVQDARNFKKILEYYK